MHPIIDHDDDVDNWDKSLLLEVMYNQDLYNVDGDPDGFLTQNDVDMIEEIVMKKLRAEEIPAADINGDGRITRMDWQKLDWAMKQVEATLAKASDWS